MNSKYNNECHPVQSTWDWSISSTNIVADVAYDMFTSATSGGSAAYEIMVWLANYNAVRIPESHNTSYLALTARTGTDLVFLRFIG